MLEIGLFHNGASSLPVTTNKDGVTFNKGSLPEVHRVAQETLVNQVRQGILAEKLGFQSFWLTEHHFPCNRLTQQGLTYIGGVEIECHILKISDPRNGLSDCTQPPPPPGVEALRHGYQYMSDNVLDDLEPIITVLEGKPALR
jgi:hypothetical protein